MAFTENTLALANMCLVQRWGEYSTNVLEYKYDLNMQEYEYSEKQMYSSTITLQYTRLL